MDGVLGGRLPKLQPQILLIFPQKSSFPATFPESYDPFMGQGQSGLLQSLIHTCSVNSGTAHLVLGTSSHLSFSTFRITVCAFSCTYVQVCTVGWGSRGTRVRVQGQLLCSWFSLSSLVGSGNETQAVWLS